MKIAGIVLLQACILKVEYIKFLGFLIESFVIFV